MIRTIRGAGKTQVQGNRSPLLPCLIQWIRWEGDSVLVRNSWFLWRWRRWIWSLRRQMLTRFFFVVCSSSYKRLGLRSVRRSPSQVSRYSRGTTGVLQEPIRRSLIWNRTLQGSSHWAIQVDRWFLVLLLFLMSSCAVWLLFSYRFLARNASRDWSPSICICFR